MRLIEFNDAYNIAKRRVGEEGASAVAEAQQSLRELIGQLATEEDRGIAVRLIEKLPQHAEPPPPAGDWIRQALEIERAAYLSTGTDEERIAFMAEARRKIFEIANQAPKGEAARIRGLTRALEHVEDNLRDPYWPFDGPQPANN